MQFYQESNVIEYLYSINKITIHQKNSLLGMLNDDVTSVITFIERTKLFNVVIGDFGCGVECCGSKENYMTK
jgi:hypothetical protein